MSYGDLYGLIALLVFVVGIPFAIVFPELIYGKRAGGELYDEPAIFRMAISFFGGMVVALLWPFLIPMIIFYWLFAFVRAVVYGN